METIKILNKEHFINQSKTKTKPLITATIISVLKWE